jgi:uncharacterized membrane protein YidH (DUF202 family)
VSGTAPPGLARERTDLAWTRTAAGFAAVGLALVRMRPAVGLFVLAFCGAVWATGRVRTAATQPRAVLLVTVVTTAVSLAALALVVLAP